MLHICLSAQGRPLQLPFLRATCSPELHQLKMKARWLFPLFCLFSVPGVTGKSVKMTPWLSLWWRVVRGRMGLVGLTWVSCSCWWWFSISWQLSDNPSYNVQLVRSKWLVLSSRLLNSKCLTCPNNPWDELTWSWGNVCSSQMSQKENCFQWENKKYLSVSVLHTCMQREEELKHFKARVNCTGATP